MTRLGVAPQGVVGLAFLAYYCYSIYHSANRVIAIYQLLLGWKTCKYYHETDELPNPRPTQPEENQVASRIWASFFPQRIFFLGLALILYRKQTTTKPGPTQFNSPQTPCYCYSICHSANVPRERQSQKMSTKPKLKRVPGDILRSRRN